MKDMPHIMTIQSYQRERERESIKSEGDILCRSTVDDAKLFVVPVVNLETSGFYIIMVDVFLLCFKDIYCL